MSIKTSSIQYENDELMTKLAGNDYGIACCVSCMRLGEQMQFFGARCNVAKALLYAINGGVDEVTGERVVPDIPYLIPDPEGFLDYELVKESFLKVLEHTIKIYVQANNIIHYMHDKYAYEASQMALHDTNVERLMAFGIAGFSVAVDSLSAIKFAKVFPIRDDKGITVGFRI
jgi:formate C-acetyltransferase